MDPLLGEALMAAQQYFYNPADLSFSSNVEEKLENLLVRCHSWAKCVIAESQIEANALIVKLFNQIRSLLEQTECSPSVLVAAFSFLFDISWVNPVVRCYLQQRLQLDIVLSICVMQIRQRELDEAIFIKGLKLLQLFTYNCHLTWHTVAVDLANLLYQEICNCCDNPKAESLPYCLGVLLNYARQINEMIDWIKMQDNLQEFNRTVLLVLKQGSASVLIPTTYFVILTFKDMREMILSADRNLIETFKCIVNVICKGESFLARFYAVDLFIHLISETRVCRQLLASSLLPDLLGVLCSLFVSLQGHLNQVFKVYQLFLMSCNVDGIREAFCTALISAEPTNHQRLTCPLLAVMEMANASPDLMGGFSELPIEAVQVLRFVLTRLLDVGGRILDYVASENLMQLLEECLKTTLETSNELIREKSLRIYEALLLATLICRDETLRSDVLETVDTILCAHLVQFQLLSNPVASSPLSMDPYPDWSIIGVNILLTVVCFLTDQADLSKSHGMLFEDLIKDNRLLPFLAFALVSGREVLVACALKLLRTPSCPLNSFAKKLSKLIAKQISCRSVHSLGSGESSNSWKTAGDLLRADNNPGNSFEEYCAIKAANGKRISELDSILRKLRSTHIDTKTSSVIDVYEAKISALQFEVAQLEEQLRIRIETMRKSDQLFANFLRQSQEAKKEEEKVRAMLREAEKSKEDMERRLQQNTYVIEELKESEDRLQKRIENLETALESSKREVECEKDMHSALRGHYDKMKANFEAVSTKLMETEEDAKKQKKLIKQKTVELEEMTEARRRLELDSREQNSRYVQLENELKRVQASLQNLESDSKLLENKNCALLSDLSKKSAEADSLKGKVQKLEDEIAKFAQMREMIHKLTGGG
ncbi:hypothetical protein M514_01867 [Trichuris suis]|uniref:CIP2A N-terminal domain-containing protein n=1 Tax=Trichuris suis TaxID=68888 RepID=A0A085NTE8_9BILA|nr:hypothetical protein M514_01867 [Trichuris suis]